jgi:hypothetical protein
MKTGLALERSLSAAAAERAFLAISTETEEEEKII